jgi:putative serine protease PepD
MPSWLSLALAGLIALSVALPALPAWAQDEVVDPEPALVEELPAEQMADETNPAPDAPPTVPLPGAPAGLSEREVAAKVIPSIVQIRLGDFGGSGVKVAQGVLTAAHLVSRGTQIEVISSSGQRAPATVQRCDAKKDIALLRTDLALPSLTFSPARAHAQGDPILVFGYPSADVLGGQATLTRGLISAIRTEEDGTLLVQTDASMNPGSSGGALVDSRGDLLAIAAFAVRGTTGLNFGVATESIQAMLDGQPTSCPAPTPTAAATPTPGVGGIVLQDNFDDEARGILPRSSTDPAKWSRGYVGGEYQLQRLDAAMSGVPYASVPGTYGNASIAIDFRLVGDPGTRSVIVTCRGDDADSGYAFQVAPGPGLFSLSRLDSGTQVELVTQRTSTLRQGGATNRIELTCAGDQISGSVNGTPVATVRDNVHPGTGGMIIALIGRAVGEARFDNLVVTRR